MKTIIICIFVLLAPLVTVMSQEIPHTPDSLQYANKDSLVERLHRIEIELKEIKIRVFEKERQDELQRLIEQAGRLATQPAEQKLDVSKKYFSGVRQQQGLNPNISFGMDFFAGISSSKDQVISEPGIINYGNNGFHLREAQLSLIAPLDPFTRGKGFIAATPEGIEVDEVYIEWLNLPLHMNLKAGYFRPEFGLFNRYHDHALPQFDRPRALVNLFGLAGLYGMGIAGNFMLPTLLFSDASSLEIATINGGNNISFSDRYNSGLIVSGQFLNYYDLTSSSYLEFRLSGTGGKNNEPLLKYRSYIYSAGMAYKWTPTGREKYRSIDWRSEILYSIREYDAGRHKALGFYSSLQNKLSARFWISGRVGYSEVPYDPSQYEWDFTASFDFWQSEFVLTRLQYQYNNREMYFRRELYAPFPSEHSVIIQVSWAMGPHKHEAY